MTTINQARLAAIQERARHTESWTNPEQWAGHDPDQEAMEHIAAAIRRRLAQQDERIARLEQLAYNQSVLLTELSESVRTLLAQRAGDHLDAMAAIIGNALKR